MRLQKFKKIDTASFKNFSWQSDVNDFVDVNVFLGWNGSGKTVISRIMRSLEKRDILNLPSTSEFSFCIDTQIYSEKSLDGFQDNVRVFNEDYINEMMTQGALPYIFYVGEDPVDYSKKEEEVGELETKKSEIKCIDTHSEIAESVAESVRNITGIGNIKKELEPGVFNSYYKTSFNKRIDFFSKNIAEEEKIDKYLLPSEKVRSFQDQLANQDLKQKEFETIKKWNDWLIDNIQEINDVLSAEPLHEKSSRIEKYNKDHKKYDWIREGVDVHKLSDDKAKHKICLFCNSPINNIEELLKHFTNDILELNNKIVSFSEKLDEGKKELVGVTRFYDGLSNTLNEKVEAILLDLKDKQQNPTTPKTEIEFSDQLTSEESILEPLQDIAHQLERHFVAKVYQKYTDEKQKLDTCQKSLNGICKKLEDAKRDLATLKSKAKNVHTPAKKLSELLNVVFPYKQIELIDSDDGVGYEIHRFGEECDFKTLSEGERNFIALAYFLTSINTEEEDTRLDKNGIVVIDDPVSSLDANSIFQIFSIIANEIEFNNSRQYLFLTHNLDFYAHLCHHFDKKPVNFYQVQFNGSGSQIQNIHEMLRDFKSDYQYSVSLLWDKKDSCDIEAAYHMVNLLRRVWETFLYFKFGRGDLRGKLDQAYKAAVKTKKEKSNPQNHTQLESDFNTNFLAMYRFINYGSHEFSSIKSFDPTILSDASKRISDFFDIVELIDKHHYKAVKGS